MKKIRLLCKNQLKQYYLDKNQHHKNATNTKKQAIIKIEQDLIYKPTESSMNAKQTLLL